MSVEDGMSVEDEMSVEGAMGGGSYTGMGGDECVFTAVVKEGGRFQKTK